jgi:cell division transport system ATP-binding protein
MIEFHQVSKTYPPKTAALIDITFTINKGEFVFLTGPSGAGKTTLLKLLFRDEDPSGGHIVFDGQNICRLGSRGVARLRRRMGLVFQEFKLLPRLTALENVSLAAEVIGVPRKESQTRARQLLADLGLQTKIATRPPALSGGEQQRVAIARALINDPVLLLADEPTGNVDAQTAEEIMGLFLKVCARNTTLLIASHDLETIKRYGSRVLWLRDGRLVDDLERVVKKGTVP